MNEFVNEAIQHDLRKLEKEFGLVFTKEKFSIKPASQLRDSDNKIRYDINVNAFINRSGAVILQTDYYNDKFYDFTLTGDIECEVDISYIIKKDMIVRQPVALFKVVDFALSNIECEYFDRDLTDKETNIVYENTADDIIETSHQIYLDDGTPLIFPLKILKI